MMRRESFILVLLAGVLAGRGVAQQNPTPGADKPPTGLTGVLSEEEFKALHELKGEKAPAPKGVLVDVEGGKAYLSLPTGKPPFPAVIVIHEWWGLNDHIKHWADRLAADGYAALAVDLYKGHSATNSDEAMKLMKEVKQEEAEVTLRAAHKFLAADERVAAKKRAVLGWCFGGAQSLALGLTGAELDAVVIYYGRLVTDQARLKSLRAPVCGVFGTKDRSIPSEQIDAFDAALKEAGITHEIWRYDAEHAFANPSGGRYDSKSASEAWAHVRAFLEKHLKKS